jgi:hypothetical protein
VIPEITARLKQLDIWVMSEGMFFDIFVRDGCLAMVQMAGGAFMGMGSTGISTDDGLLFLVWRDEQPLLVGHGVEIPALPEQVERMLRFSADLKMALGLLEP